MTKAQRKHSPASSAAATRHSASESAGRRGDGGAPRASDEIPFAFFFVAVFALVVVLAVAPLRAWPRPRGSGASWRPFGGELLRRGGEKQK